MTGTFGDRGSSQNKSRLVDEALKLLIETRELSPEMRERRLESWQSQSADHAAALKSAIGTWQTLDEVQDSRLGAVDKVKLWIEVAIASAKDYPVRATALAFLIVCSILVPYTYFVDPNAQRFASFYAPYQFDDSEAVKQVLTGRGEQRQVRLRGGAVLWLNWSTEVLIDGRGDEIVVDVLLGDVLVSVPDADERKIMIRAGNTTVRPGKSEFAVHSHGQQDAFFQVRKGSISIAGADGDLLQKLNAAQQMFYFNGRGHSIEEVDVASIATWQQGKLVFRQRPLVSVLHALSHYTEEKLTVGVLPEEGRGVTGTYSIHRADKAVTQLAAAYDLEVLSLSEGGLVIQSQERRD
ncbi:MAG: FecR domain-containing protein [Pseudomonadota bacterium]